MDTGGISDMSKSRHFLHYFGNNKVFLAGHGRLGHVHAMWFRFS